MAKTRTSFKKNDKRINRRGAPKIDPIIKRLRDLRREDLTLNFSEKIDLSVPELTEIVQNNQTKVIDIIICSSLMKAAKTGDFHYVQPYIEYIFGKPVTKLEHTGKDGGPIETTSPRERLASQISGIAAKLGAVKDPRKSK